MAPTTTQINAAISARIPKNWAFNFSLYDAEIFLFFDSPKLSIHIIAPIPKDFDVDPIEAIEKIVLKYLNGRFYK